MINVENKHICFFNTNISYGGGEKWHIDTAEYLQSKNLKVLFYANKNAKYLSSLKKLNISTITTRLNNLSFLNPIKIFSIAAKLKKNNISSIIINLPSDLKVAGPAAKMAGVKNIIYRRGSAITVKNSHLNKFLFKRIITKVLVNSEETKKTISTNFPFLLSENKIELIYNGIDIKKYDSEDFLPIYKPNKNEIIIGNAGRMVNQKNQIDLIKIASHLKKKGVKFKMIIAGDGNLKPELEKLSSDLNLTNEILFTGYVDNIKSFMESIDIFALTSHWEGFGYVMAEAMASSKAVVAYNISSNPELVTDNKTGFLIEKDNIEQFSEKMELLINDRKMRESFGVEGRRVVEKQFSFERNINNLMGLVD